MESVPKGSIEWLNLSAMAKGQPRSESLFSDALKPNGNYLAESSTGPTNVVTAALEERMSHLDQLSRKGWTVPTNSSNGLPPIWETDEDLQWPLAPLTTMAEVAELFEPPEQTTSLFLNFAGTQSISPFETTTGDRDRDIQEIIYYVSQALAPFNVCVKEFVGVGQYAQSGGATTIFIGDNPNYTDWYEGATTGDDVYNYARAVGNSDYPCPSRGVNHQPNSDPFNRGWVDPISKTVVDGVITQPRQSWNNLTIAMACLHEAGHTFGLAHVLAYPEKDMMSYNSSNRMFRYEEHPLTNLNSVMGSSTAEPNENFTAAWYYHRFDDFDGPQEVGNALDTQNSFRVLAATIGLRQDSDDVANIARWELVHSIHQDGTRPTVRLGDVEIQTIDHYGDYDVFQFTAENSQDIGIDVIATEDRVWFNPMFLVFDEDGEELLGYADKYGDDNDAHGAFSAIAGESYRIVVGAKSNSSFGEYLLSIHLPEFERTPGAEDVGGLKFGSEPPNID